MPRGILFIRGSRVDFEISALSEGRFGDEGLSPGAQ